MKSNALRYTLCVKGVFGRNRKVKREFVRLGYSEPDAPISAATLQPLVERELRKLKLRSGGEWDVEESPVELSEYAGSDGQTLAIECCSILRGKAILAGVVA